MKICGFGLHEVTVLWKAKTRTSPSYCKTCWFRENPTVIKKSPPTSANEATEPKKQYTIPKVSDKQVKRLVEYRKVRDKFLKENPICEVCGSPNVQLHHKKGRIGDLLTDTAHFASLCDKHHRYAELHPEWAKTNGLSENRLDKSA